MSQQINRKQLAIRVAEACEFGAGAVDTILKATLDEIEDELARGGEVKLSGLGTFKVSHRAARTGRNPQTGEPLTIPATRAVSFKPGKALKDALNPS